MSEEISNLIESLEEDLEWFRNRKSAYDASDHKRTRILLSLAQAIQELQLAKPAPRGNKEG